MQVTLDRVAVSYTLPDGQHLPAIQPITRDIQPGSFVAIIGASGCGKSTLLRTIAGLQTPTQGAVYLDGQRIDNTIRGVSMMFQDANLMPWRTVEDNIALPLTLRGERPDVARRQVQKVLPALGLSQFRKSYPRELSGGMAQRAALGRVLVQEPRLMLLDEPFGALDALTREQISLDVLSIWQAQQPTVILVTHSIQEAVLMADRILVMSARPGQIIEDVHVNLPRPRSLDMMYREEFNHLMRYVREALNR